MDLFIYLLNVSYSNVYCFYWTEFLSARASIACISYVIVSVCLSVCLSVLVSRPVSRPGVIETSVFYHMIA